MNTLDRLKALSAAATPGPWYASENDLYVTELRPWGRHIAEITTSDETAALIAAMRNSIDKLLAVVEDAMPLCRFVKKHGGTYKTVGDDEHGSALVEQFEYTLAALEESK